MNVRLKIICVLFGIAYFYFLGMSVIQDIPDFTRGFKAGFKAGAEDGANIGRGFDRETHKPDPATTLSFTVKPVSGESSFPNTVLNLKTGESMQNEFSNFRVKIDRAPLPSWLKIARALFLLIAVFPLLFTIVFIPVQIYKVIRSIVKDNIFEPRNIKRLRWIGYCLLFIFVVLMLFGFISTVEARTLIHLEDYRIVFRIEEEYYWLLFGLVTLMFAELLKISHSMKEEQELTI